MSQQRPEPARTERIRVHCDWCIYGAAAWWVEWSYVDSLFDSEAHLCDRCLESLYERQEHGLANVYVVEEA